LTNNSVKEITKDKMERLNPRRLMLSTEFTMININAKRGENSRISRRARHKLLAETIGHFSGLTLTIKADATHWYKPRIIQSLNCTQGFCVKQILLKF